MDWYNEPAQWRLDGGTLHVTAGGQTDYWRVTVHDFIKDDAPFYYDAIEGDFTATVKVTGDYVSLYDQAGLMVRENETVWLKCGIEYLDGVQQASAVLTRDFSDWSIVPLPENPQSTWFRVKRIGTAVEVYFSHDGEHFTMIRQGYLTDVPRVQVGMMCAAPQGDGFSAIFEHFQIV